MIGKYYKDNEISEFAIVPANGDNTGEICGCINLDEQYSQYLIGYNDFKVIVLLDFPETLRLEGYLLTELLETILYTQHRQ